MRISKCKNSVFCGFLLICFFIGTICGVLLFRLLQTSHSDWTEAYFSALSVSVPSSGLIAFAIQLRPLLTVYFLSRLRLGDKVLPVYILFRGLCSAYYFAFAFHSGVLSPVHPIQTLILCITMFYLISSRRQGYFVSRFSYNDATDLLIVFISSAISYFSSICRIFG